MTIEILEYDIYFNYVTKAIYTYNDNNGYPKMVDKTFVFHLYEDLSSTYIYYEVVNNSVDYYKNIVGWGKNKYNVTYHFIEQMKTPTLVSFKDFLANPELYVGKYIEIADDLLLLVKYNNDVTDKWLFTFKNPYRTDEYILINYEIYGFESSYHDYQKIRVAGYVWFAADEETPYIDLLHYTLE